MAMVAVDNPMERAHAKFSASQTKRWMSCPGAVTLVDTLPEKMRPKQSKFAALGTAAHALGEACLKARLPDCRSYMDYWIHVNGVIQKRTPDQDEIDQNKWFQVDFDMADAVDVYLSTVYSELERLGPDAELSIERRFDLTWLRDEMFGTNDASISLFLDELVVIDYKHGQGVPVEVSHYDYTAEKEVGNSQLLYYALGAAKAFDFTHSKITLIIVQPRCPHNNSSVRRFSLPMSDLLEFADKLGAAVDIANEANKSYHEINFDRAKLEWENKYLSPGEHCRTTYCPMIALCPAMNRLVEQETAADFEHDDPEDIGTLPLPTGLNAIAKALKWVPLIDARNRAISELAMRLAEQGVKVPGHKLVHKRSTRIWTKSEIDLANALTKAGYSPTDFMTMPSIKSPAQVEKLGKAAKQIVNGHKLSNDDVWIIEPASQKSPGGLTLVIESDPRAEVTIESAASDFPDDSYVFDNGGD